MKNITELTETNFAAEVYEADTPVLVDFYAPWCGPCKMLAPTLEKLAQDYAGRVKIGKLNVDDAPRLAGEFNITGVPTLMIFRGRQVQDTVVGLVSARDLKAKLDAASTAAATA